ncbi:MAG: TlpA disulfide reductase family protein [Bdellovibrionota bacterium]|nr:TlpA family protein disulfide reductase [Deltaproteobacteria bacterium]
MRYLLFSFLLWGSCHSLAYACDQNIGSKDGQCAPNFTLQATDGRIFELKKQLGKVVIVNFWATWCEPCIEELPALNKLYQKKIENVEFVSVSIDSNQAAIDRFFAMNKGIKVEFPILKDFDKKTANQWGTNKVPETYIIDKNGVVVHKEIGIREWDEGITSKYLKLLATQ